MAKPGVSAQEASEMLRTHARSNRRKLHEVAAHIVSSQSTQPTATADA